MSIIGGLIIVGAALYVALTKNYGNGTDQEQRKTTDMNTELVDPVPRRVHWADEVAEGSEGEEDPMLAKADEEWDLHEPLAPSGASVHLGSLRVITRDHDEDIEGIDVTR